MGARTIHPFPARMAPEIATDMLAIREDGRPLNVLDPMCGSGTVLSVASSRGHNAVGFDVDPLAVLMTQVAVAPIVGDALDEAAKELIGRVQASRRRLPPWDDRESMQFAEYWFDTDQRRQLTRFSIELNRVESIEIKRALQIALSRIIVTKAPRASLAGDTSHSRPHKVIQSSNYDVVDGFSRSVRELRKLLDARELSGSAEASLGDSRELSEVQQSSIDIAITSPPYLNAIDYLRGHKMSLIWLGYSIPELRRIRSDSIGAERGLESLPLDRVVQMVDSVKSAVPNPERLPVGTITRYVHDLCRFAEELHRVTRPGAKVIAVVGNSTLRGNFISNDGLVAKALTDSGFISKNRVERELPENKRYMPISTSDAESSMATRMRAEVVLTMEKAS